MEDPIDWCRYFADIEKDPAAITPQLTIRQWMQMQDHVAGCDNCNLRIERVMAQMPKDEFPERGMN